MDELLEDVEMTEIEFTQKPEPPDYSMTTEDDPLDLNLDLGLDLKEENIPVQEVQIQQPRKVAVHCNICQKRFNDIDLLSDHIEEMHIKKSVPPTTNVVSINPTPQSVTLSDGKTYSPSGVVVLPNTTSMPVGSIALPQGMQGLPPGSVLVPVVSSNLQPGLRQVHVSQEISKTPSGSKILRKIAPVPMPAPFQPIKFEPEENKSLLEVMLTQRVQNTKPTVTYVLPQTKVESSPETVQTTYLPRKQKYPPLETATLKTVKNTNLTPKQVNQCYFCKKEFKTSQELVLHRALHVRKKDRDQFSCEMCRLFFDTSEKLSSHYKIDHIGEELHQCEFCPQKFMYVKTLLSHARSHISTVGNECKECNLYFVTKKLWTAHMKLHNELYQCHYCNAKFGLNQKLFEHLNTHPEFCLYRCEICRAGFKIKEMYSKHMHEHNINKYCCEICNKRFPSNRLLFKNHMTRHAPLYCHVCNANYNDYDGLLEHMKAEKHEYECGSCGKRFMQKCLLRDHLFIEHKIDVAQL